jgi:carbon monoxide dehydrogenase subunit G
MKIEQSLEIQHPRAYVWRKFNDVRFVAECLPGASIISEQGENRYKGRLSVKVGPMVANFLGEFGIESQEETWSGVVSGKGADSGSGSRVSATMTYALTEGASVQVTKVAIASDINLAGPLAQFGKGAIVQEIAHRITAAFAANFEARLTAESPGPVAAGTASPAVEQSQALDAGGLLWAVLWDRLRAFFRNLFGRS